MKKKCNNEASCERDGNQEKKIVMVELEERICHECHHRSVRAIPANSFLSTVLKV